MTTLNNPSAQRIVEGALRKINVLPPGYTYSSTQLLTAEIALNALTKEFQALGMQAYLIASTSLLLVNGAAGYSIGEALPGSVPMPSYLYRVDLLQPNSSQIEMTQYSAYDFSNLPNNSTGIPVGYNYLPGEFSGILSVWPTPDASVPVGTVVKLLYSRPMDIVQAPTDLVDYPAEWENPLVYHLALLLSDEYGVPEQKKMWLEKQADKHLALVLGTTNEQGSLFVQPDWQWRYNN